MLLLLITERRLLRVSSKIPLMPSMLILPIVVWEAHEPGYFSVALFDHREHTSLDSLDSIILRSCRHARMRRRGSSQAIASHRE